MKYTKGVLRNQQFDVNKKLRDNNAMYFRWLEVIAGKNIKPPHTRCLEALT
jgi:hypothetical protein